MPSLITPADAFRLLLHARLSARYSRRFKFADKITSYYWFWRWKSQGIPRPVHAIADETLKALCRHVRDGTIRLLSRSQIPPVYIDRMDCSLGEVHVFNQTLTIDAQSASPARKYEHVFCDESDVMKVIRDASKNRSLSAATEKNIRDVIADVYATAQPNINQLPKLVLPRLKALGYTASGRQIKKIGLEPQFALRRRMPGPQKLP